MYAPHRCVPTLGKQVSCWELVLAYFYESYLCLALHPTKDAPWALWRECHRTVTFEKTSFRYSPHFSACTSRERLSHLRGLWGQDMIDLLERVRSLVISEGLSAENEKPFLTNTLKVETAVYVRGYFPAHWRQPQCSPRADHQRKAHCGPWDSKLISVFKWLVIFVLWIKYF